MKLLKKFVLVLLAVLFVFKVGVWVGGLGCAICPPQDVDLSLFWQSWEQIEKKFVDKEKIDHEKMIYGAISGMVNSLDDPYTIFLDPSKTKRFIEDTEGTFEGVGMEIGIRNNQLQVISPLEGTPAKKAGLRAGDKILKVEDKSTSAMTIDEAVNLIRGEKGTEIILTIYRDDWEKAKEIKLVRGVIQIPSLSFEIIENDIAYVQLYQFSEKAATDFKNVSFEISNKSQNG